MQAYQAELKDYTLELPTITFDKTYLLQDPAFDLHLEFHGRAHTAGDLFLASGRAPSTTSPAPTSNTLSAATARSRQTGR